MVGKVPIKPTNVNCPNQGHHLGEKLRESGQLGKRNARSSQKHLSLPGMPHVLASDWLRDDRGAESRKFVEDVEEGELAQVAAEFIRYSLNTSVNQSGKGTGWRQRNYGLETHLDFVSIWLHNHSLVEHLEHQISKKFPNRDARNDREEILKNARSMNSASIIVKSRKKI